MALASFRIAAAAACAGLLALAAIPGPSRAQGASGDHGVDISVLSGRPDMVTAGDALVRFDVADGIAMDSVAITRNGEDITATLHRDDGARTFLGIVGGLAPGENHLFAEWSGSGKSRPRRQLALTNYPKEGPVFSGPYQWPFACEAHRYQMPVVPGTAVLQPPQEPECSIPTRVDYFYRSTAGAYKPWTSTPPSNPPFPTDIATTTNTRGATVPLIVRMETGTANRGIYYSLMLHDPRSEAEPSFLRRSAGWNGRLIYLIGDSCNGGWYRQGRAWVGGTKQPGPATNVFLSQGYALASSTLNDTSTDCNPVESAETMMMTKERFIEAYGPPDHTTGFGVSGGATTQHSIADNYPGLFDGIVPGESFPEHLFAVEYMWHDARILEQFFKTRGQACGGDAAPCWTPAQIGAVTGFDGNATLAAPNMLSNYRNLEPDSFCPRDPGTGALLFDPALLYDPVTNPGGVRCDIFSAFANQLGYYPGTRTVRRPLDNVGVQYGLGALRAGTITAAQFVDLNEHVGGLDLDGHFSASRTAGDLDAIRAAYRSGLVTNGGLGLATTPIIDYRAYTDDYPPGDVHLRYFSFSTRERLRRSNGHFANQVMLLEDAGPGRQIYSVVNSGLLRFAFAQMDVWLDTLATDGSRDPTWKKVVASKPDTLLEGCRLTRGANPRADFSDFFAETMTADGGTCGAADKYPVHAFPRGVAGESIASDLVKCSLKPVDWADYPVTFTPEQQQRLLAAFPDGVCDYSKPGVGQQPPDGTWQRY